MTTENKNSFRLFGTKLRTAIGNESLSSFAKRSDMSINTLKRYLDGERYPTLNTLNQIASALDLDDFWFATDGITQNAPTKIPHYNVNASAGSGLVAVDSSDDFAISINPEILIEYDLPTSDVFSMLVSGDSMEPALFDGDTILVNRVSSPLVIEGVCVIRIQDQVFVKRIQFNKFSGYMQVDSDSSFYRTYTITGEDLNEVEIIGKVICTLFSKVRRLPSYGQPINDIKQTPVVKG